MKSAPAVMMFLTFLQYLPYIVLEIPHLSRSVKMIVSLLPLSGSSIGLVTIAEWEKIGLGAKWNNLGDSLSVLTAFSISDVMLMLLVDIFIYGFLTWYIENVFPGEFGVPNKPFFFLTKNYWFGNKQTSNDADRQTEDIPLLPT
ncbi:phospholipid-transporting ATPase ABCA3-like [Bolinopsis microptera]|uniref:phospholipid-transporting ATPase ABCA3-like n=1 Tax=Bolinopsis microptera TaxID=2820187 RepID=UPI003078D724